MMEIIIWWTNDYEHHVYYAFDKIISTMLSDRLIVMYICYDVMEIMMVMHIMDVIMHKRVVWLRRD